MAFLRLIFSIFIIFPLFGCEENDKPVSYLSIANSKTPIYAFKIIKSYPHDPHNFTEGLVLDNDYLFESAGLYQQSKLQKKAFSTGKLVDEYALPPQYFAEGIAVIGDYIYQLTYKEHTGFVYDKNTLKLKKIFHYPNEGWGLTSDGKQLIMSDGSDTLSFIDPTTFTLIRTIKVHDEERPISLLNALGYVSGKIYANVWPTDIIAIISPETGKIEGWINIASLNTPENCAATSCVSNGIAFIKKNNSLLVTGKNWLQMYDIKLSR